MGTTSVSSVNTIVNSLVTTTLNAAATTNIISPIINSTGIWNHTGAMNIVGPTSIAGVVGITGVTTITGATNIAGLLIGTDIYAPIVRSTFATLGTHRHTGVSGPTSGPIPFT